MKQAPSDTDIDMLSKFAGLVGGHDDRGLILALAAFAEDSLGRLILAYLVEGKQSRELVEGFNAPFGTLSARVKGAYALGLLSREQYEDLEIARQIRNAFAHDWEECSFAREDIKSKIGKLHAYTDEGRPLDRGVQGRQRLAGSILIILMGIRFLTSDLLREGRRLQLANHGLTSFLIKRKAS